MPVRGRGVGVVERAGTGFGNVCRGVERSEGGEARVELGSGEWAKMGAVEGILARQFQ